MPVRSYPRRVTSEQRPLLRVLWPQHARHAGPLSNSCLLWLVPPQGHRSWCHNWCLSSGPQNGHGKPLQFRLDHKTLQPGAIMLGYPPSGLEWRQPSSHDSRNWTPFRTTHFPQHTPPAEQETPRWLLSYGWFSLQEPCGRGISIPQEE